MAEEKRFKIDWPPCRTPHTKRDRNWRPLEIGQRIVNKHGVVTDWRLMDVPWTVGGWHGLPAWASVECVRCKRTFDRRLGNIIQGRTMRCQSCATRARYAEAVTG